MNDLRPQHLPLFEIRGGHCDLLCFQTLRPPNGLEHTLDTTECMLVNSECGLSRPDALDLPRYSVRQTLRGEAAQSKGPALGPPAVYAWSWRGH